ncbi:translation initiation factor IF-2-like [Culex quinquefasciatus]|uniref:translation initiation factor IF-2-like n=1 Tax=Culex quinquefasciatus TaxID=7176 RepID=UPI0018E2F19C|nr:translation initiation factor IF-2-like [Culex quinquefasciatus]
MANSFGAQMIAMAFDGPPEVPQVRESSASPNSRPENRKGKYGPPGPVYGPVGANRDTMPADVCTDVGRVSPYRPPRNRPRPGPARNRQRWLPPKVRESSASPNSRPENRKENTVRRAPSMGPSGQIGTPCQRTCAPTLDECPRTAHPESAPPRTRPEPAKMASPEGHTTPPVDGTRAGPRERPRRAHPADGINI